MPWIDYPDNHYHKQGIWITDTFRCPRDGYYYKLTKTGCCPRCGELVQDPLVAKRRDHPNVPAVEAARHEK